MSLTKKRYIRFFLATFIFFTITAILICFAPRIIPTSQIQTRIEKFLSSKLGQPAHTGSVLFTSIIPPTLEIKDLYVEDDPTLSNRPLMEIHNLRIQVPFSILWSKNFSISKAIVENATFNLRRCPDGNWWPIFASVQSNDVTKETNNESFSTTIDSLEINNGQLFVFSDFPIEVQVTPSKVFHCENIKLVGSFSKETLSCNYLETFIGGGKFFGQMNFNLHSLNFNINGDISNTPMVNIIPDSQEYVSGALSGKFSLSGQFRKQTTLRETLEGSGHLDLHNGELIKVNIGKDISKNEKTTDVNGTKFEIFSGNFLISKNQLETKNLICRTLNNDEITGKGTIDFGVEPTNIDYIILAKVTPETFNKLQKHRPIASVLSTLLSDGKNVQVPIKIFGDINNPTIEINWPGFLHLSNKSSLGDLLKTLPLPGAP